MFKRHDTSKLHSQIDTQKENAHEEHTIIRNKVNDEYNSSKNIIVRGSKFTGDIKLNNDMELHGELEGNITSEGESNILVTGKCRGRIQTEGGNIDIDGQVSGGDIITGGNIKIMGKFNGGRAEAKGKIFVNGQFNGVLESYDIEIGPNARGKGDLYYRDSISIAKGAQVELNIQRSQKNKHDIKKPIKKNVDMQLYTNIEMNSTDRLINEVIKVK